MTYPSAVPPGQFGHEQVAQMSAAQIADAFAAGQLQHVLTTAAPSGVAVPPGQFTPEALPLMSPEQIVAALAAGQLDHALGRPTH